MFFVRPGEMKFSDRLLQTVRGKVLKKYPRPSSSKRNRFHGVVFILYLQEVSFSCRHFWEETHRYAQILSTWLLVREVWRLIPGLVKPDAVSPTARHRGDVSSELCCPDAKPWRCTRHSLHASRGNIASTPKIWFFIVKNENDKITT